VAYLAGSDADVEAYFAAQGEAPAEARPAPEAKPQAAKPAAQPSPTAPKAPAPTTGAGRVKASPAARRLAAERGIDLAALGAGSGPGGRIVSSDVPTEAPRRPAAAAMGEATRHEMTSMRRAIGRGLLWSKQNIPHFYMKATIDAEPLWAAYQQVKAAGEFKCTVNDFVVAACAKALQEFPPFRMKLEEDALVETAESNIGIAVGTEDGLLVPVLAGAERLSFREIAAESRRVVGNARSGKLEGVGLGVFTVTNLGMFGVEEFSAIINPPEAAILAVGAVREGVVVRNGAIRPQRVMTMTLSADHRIVDGLVGAQFCARLKELLEAPEGLL
jgi:pyruvate dehydrogenase E2 component (dihydrolipoamide acetyltransferase)